MAESVLVEHARVHDGSANPRQQAERALATWADTGGGLLPGVLMIRTLVLLDGKAPTPDSIAASAVRPEPFCTYPEASALWFADEAEALACYSIDVLAGAAGQLWYWRPRLSAVPPGATPLGAAWLADPRWIPATSARLDEHDPPLLPRVLAAMTASERRHGEAAISGSGRTRPRPPLAGRLLARDDRVGARATSAAPDAVATAEPAPSAIRAARTGDSPLESRPRRAGVLAGPASPLQEERRAAALESPRPLPPGQTQPGPIDRPAESADASHGVPGPAAADPAHPRHDTSDGTPLRVASATARSEFAAVAERPEPDRSSPVPADDVGDRAGAHLASGTPSTVAGLLFGINALLRSPGGPRTDQLSWRDVRLFLHRMARRGDNRRRTRPDPLWEMLSGLAREHGGGRPSLPRWWSPALQWLDEQRLPARAFLLPGGLALSRTHLDVVFGLDQVDLRFRRLGLDLDPGWMPGLGRVVSFHFVAGEQ